MSSWKTFNCHSCGETTSVQPCNRCQQTEQLKKQSEIMERSARESKQRADREHYIRIREQQAWEEHQQQLAEQARQIAEEQHRRELARVEHERRITAENSISKSTARSFGYSWVWIYQSENQHALDNTINEDGRISVLYYKKPYLSEDLNDAFNEGVWGRLRDELNSDLLFDTAAMQQAIALQGAAGITEIRFGCSLGFLDDMVFTFSKSLYLGEMRMDSTGKMRFYQPSDQLVLFDSFKLNLIYINAFDKWKEEILSVYNTDEAIEDRLAADRDKLDRLKISNASWHFREIIKRSSYCMVALGLLCALLYWAQGGSLRTIDMSIMIVGVIAAIIYVGLTVRTALVCVPDEK